MSRSNRGLRALALCAASVSLLAVAGAPAVAQFYPVYPPPPPPPPIYAPPVYDSMPPHEADAVVRSLGLTPLTRPRRQGPFFIVQAMGREGTSVQVTLDRRSGRVIRIARLGPDEPRVARIRPDAPRIYGPGDGEPPPGYYDEEEDELPGASRNPSGPSVITREGIQSRELPPPGGRERVVNRDPDITGSVPRDSSDSRRTPNASTSGRVDPLLGVPPEFRGRSAGDTPARVAARPPVESIPRIAPLPRPRPTDAPVVAQSQSEPKAEPAPTVEAKPEKKEPPPAAKEENPAAGWPPVQGWE